MHSSMFKHKINQISENLKMSTFFVYINWINVGGWQISQYCSFICRRFKQILKNIFYVINETDVFSKMYI